MTKASLKGKVFFLKRFNTASGMRSHVTRRRGASWTTSFKGFNTASGMRSHVTMSCTAGFESIMVVSIPQAV